MECVLQIKDGLRLTIHQQEWSPGLGVQVFVCAWCVLQGFRKGCQMLQKGVSDVPSGTFESALAEGYFQLLHSFMTCVLVSTTKVPETLQSLWRIGRSLFCSVGEVEGKRIRKCYAEE